MLCVFLLASAAQALADSRWVLMVEPSFMDYKMRRPIAGSNRTILAIVRVVDGEIQPLTREEKKSVNMTFEQIEADAQKTASAVLSHLTPRFARDKKNVIQYAVLESDNPLTASCVLAPDFASKFASTLGPDLLVAMPNRYKVLVFCRQDIQFQRHFEDIVAGYLDSTYPVSREIFALEKGRLRSLGPIQ